VYHKGFIRFNPVTKLFVINFEAIETLRLPNDIQSLIQLRLKGLKESEIELLQMAACIGSRVTKYILLSLGLCLVYN
jgi:predicted ATPase